MLTKYSAYSFLLLLLSPPLQADALTDGTLGSQVHLTDPHFTVGENLGKRVGNNLFHSFEHFNVPTDGSATFTGSLGIQNVLARVTGPTSSNIDGTLRSTIPDANLYLMNPNGIRFGEHARLDVLGSFHATTADSIRLGQDGQFNAREPSKSLLTVAPPAAFGFLSDTPATIRVEKSFLKVPSGKTFSLLGGDLQIQDGTLFCPQGHLNLVSVASSGLLPADSLDTQTFPLLGKISLTHSPDIEFQTIGGEMIANVDASGHPEGPGGRIFIRGGQLLVEGAYIFSDSYGNERGQGIDMYIQGPVVLSKAANITADNYGGDKGGDVSITATDSISLFDQPPEHLGIPRTAISANSNAEGDAGDVRINTPQLEITSGLIASSPQAGATGAGGNIFIEVGKLFLKDGAHIQGLTWGKGRAGNVNIKADSILMRDDLARMIDDKSLSTSISVGVEPDATGAGGNIQIHTGNLDLQGNAYIISDSYGTSKAGDISITATDTLTISKSTKISGLASVSRDKGDAGNIDINAKHLVLREGGFINSDARNSGQGGKITLNVENLEIDDSIITSQSTGTGNAGSIHITSHDATLNNGKITTSSTQSNGGNVCLTVNNNIFLFNGTITAQAQGEEGTDNAGNLTISHPHLFIMDQYSKLSAQANVGNGGNIKIVADNFLNPIPENVTASSEKGIDGEVTINAFQPNLAGMLTTSSWNYLRLGLLKPPRWCGRNKKRSSFAIQLQDMLWPSPSDLRFYSPVLGEE
jgi:filamentous hemagglutinin family protein